MTDMTETADVVALTHVSGVFAEQWHVLLVRRSTTLDAYPGRWALPGGFRDPGEPFHDTALRELAEETSVHLRSLTYVGRYDAPGRDPRGPVISEAFAAVLPDALEPGAADDADKAEWWVLDDALVTELAFDHGEILRDAVRLLA